MKKGGLLGFTQSIFVKKEKEKENSFFETINHEIGINTNSLSTRQRSRFIILFLNPYAIN